MAEKMDINKKVLIIYAKDMEEPLYTEKRDCYPAFHDFVFKNTKDYQGKICALYGLRRTGKTIMMQQCLFEMTQEMKEKSVYLLCKNGADMDDLEFCLDELDDKGYKNFFIDEITLLKDFQKNAHILSDYYGQKGKVVIAGTDSLNIRLAMADALYDRTVTIHTSHVPYAEYARLTGNASLDEYIEYGGLLTDKAYKDEQSRNEYLNTAVVENILHSLDYARESHKYWPSLTALYDKKTLASYINKMINRFSYDVTLLAVENDYKSSALSATRKDMKAEVRKNKLDVAGVNARTRQALGILNEDEITEPMEADDFRELKDYLKSLSLIETIPTYRSMKQSRRHGELEILMQPGMAYAHSTALLEQLARDDAWAEDCDLTDVDSFKRRADNYVKGMILEGIVLSELYRAIGGAGDKNRFYVSQLTLLAKQDSDVYHYGADSEADIIIFDRKKMESFLFEIKHSSQVVPAQYKHLKNATFIQYVNENFAPVRGVGVIYEGVDTFHEHVPYLNAEEFLKTVNRLKTIDIDLVDLKELFPLADTDY